MDIVTSKDEKFQNVSVKLLEELRGGILGEIEAVLKSAEGESLLILIHEGKNLSEKEAHLVKLRTIILEATTRALFKETGYQGSRLLCSCGCKAKFVRYDDKSYNLLVGRVELKRALYQCQGCGRYWRPLDDSLGLPAGHNSEGVERVAALLGAYMPFEAAEKVLQETSGVSLSDTSIRTISESIGAEIETIIGTEMEKSLNGELPEPEAEVLAVITGGHNLSNRHVIHCLGPVYGQDKPEAELLANCYRNALWLADDYKLKSIGFPTISTGVFGYPVEEAAEVALRTVA